MRFQRPEFVFVLTVDGVITPETKAYLTLATVREPLRRTWTPVQEHLARVSHDQHSDAPVQ